MQNRLGADPVYQAQEARRERSEGQGKTKELPGEVPMTISGLLFPESLGGYGQYQALEATASLMRPVMMVSGFGQVFGLVVITRVGQTHKHIGARGMPRMVEFEIEVKKQGGSLFSGVGGLFNV